jgi:hypothetical protein
MDRWAVGGLNRVEEETMDDRNSIQSFGEFVQSLYKARYEEFRARLDAKVESPHAFEQMRKHVMSLYEGVEAPHSFLESGGQIVDCIPIEQQSSLKGPDYRTVEPSPPPQLPPQAYATPPDGVGEVKTPPPQLHPDYRDRFGNQMWCPDGTIPRVRVTLELLARFESLEDFHRKTTFRLPEFEKGTPTGGAQRSMEAKGINDVVAGQGCRAAMNLWGPTVGPGDMSECSIWAIAFEPLQWVSCGFLIAPQLFGHANPTAMVSFNSGINGSGCLNQYCPGFVQRSSNLVVGGSIGPVSIAGGQQYEANLTLFLKNNMWQFFWNNEFVGFYPAALFQNGDLDTNNNRITAGGWVQGPGLLPAMGSGSFPSGGFGQAAYMHNIELLGSSASGPDLVIDASLRAFAPTPQCYDVAINNGSSTNWRTYIYYGGPGGC